MTFSGCWETAETSLARNMQMVVKNMRIINLTSVPIRVEGSRGVREYPVAGNVLKLDTLDETVAVVPGDEIPIARKVYFEPDSLPPVEEGTYYIVPNQVMSIIRRPDFISPDTKTSNGAKRTFDNRITSVMRFRVCDELRKEH
jgi:hypothetical protein